MIAGDRARLLGLAKGEADAELRGAAVQQLGVMGAHAELAERARPKRRSTSRKRIIQAMFVGGNADKADPISRRPRKIRSCAAPRSAISV